MIDYSIQSKCYKIWDFESWKLIVSRDVTFDESYVSRNVTGINLDRTESSNVASPGNGRHGGVRSG